MNELIYALGLFGGVFIGWFGGRLIKKYRRSKAKIHFDELAKRGFNEGDVKRTEFMFFFGLRTDAEKAAVVLRSWDYEPVIRESGDRWSLEVVTLMSVNPKSMQAIESKFEKLASENRGKFDGWGTEV